REIRSYPWLKPLSSFPFRDHTSRQRSSSTGHLNRGGLGKSILSILRFQRRSSLPFHLRVFRIFRGSSCSPSAWDDPVAALGRLLGRSKPSKSLGFTELGTTGRVKGY